jgi:hypothetical protein
MHLTTCDVLLANDYLCILSLSSPWIMGILLYHYTYTCLHTLVLNRTCNWFLYIYIYTHTHRGVPKNVYTFQEILSMYYFSKLNWIMVAMCSKMFAQKMALIKWMLASPCDREGSQRKWQKHVCRSSFATFSWLNTPWLLPTRDLKGCGVL